VGDRASAKVPTCRIDDAHRLGADAVSVQLDLNAAGLSHAVHALSLMVGEAAFYDVPVLVMVTPRAEGPPWEAAAHALRICTELGADMIKIGLASEIVTEASSSELEILCEAVRNSPPVLLSGGEIREDLPHRLAVARELGFSGACIGRHVFQDPEPEAVLETVAAAFTAPGDRSTRRP
jgi:fructose-bisphosphate aldolase / 2-amino-3,7-dideoxy-D-threo-hept-6-ulosonate synthase